MRAGAALRAAIWLACGAGRSELAVSAAHAAPRMAWLLRVTLMAALGAALTFAFVSRAPRRAPSVRMMAKAVSVPLHRIEDSETLLQCGYDAFRRRDFRQSAAAFRRATKVDPSCAEAHIGLGNLLYRRGNYTGAEHHYHEAGPRASWGLSLLLEKRGDLEAAIDVMEEYLRSEALPILTVFEAESLMRRNILIDTRKVMERGAWLIANGLTDIEWWGEPGQGIHGPAQTPAQRIEDLRKMLNGKGVPQFAYVHPDHAFNIDSVTRVEGSPYLSQDASSPVDVWIDGSRRGGTDELLAAWREFNEKKRRYHECIREGYDIPPELSAELPNLVQDVRKEDALQQPGGAAAVILGDYDSGYWIHSTHIPRCTSLRAEWVALETALRALERSWLEGGPMNLRRPVNVYTDCQGVVDIAYGDVAAPAEWIQKIDYELFQKFPRLSVAWVKGHSGLKYNELADRCAKAENDPEKSLSYKREAYCFRS